MDSSLLPLSPLDGRYADTTEPLQNYFSESAFLRDRGRVLTEADYKSWLETLNLNDETRIKLQSLTPENYAGLAVQMCDRVIKQYSACH